jgi:hypothetical protein
MLQKYELNAPASTRMAHISALNNADIEDICQLTGVQARICIVGANHRWQSTIF